MLYSHCRNAAFSLFIILCCLLFIWMWCFFYSSIFLFFVFFFWQNQTYSVHGIANWEYVCVTQEWKFFGLHFGKLVIGVITTEISTMSQIACCCVFVLTSTWSDIEKPLTPIQRLLLLFRCISAFSTQLRYDMANRIRKSFVIFLFSWMFGIDILCEIYFVFFCCNKIQIGRQIARLASGFNCIKLATERHCFIQTLVDSNKHFHYFQMDYFVWVSWFFWQNILLNLFTARMLVT